jgi:hypothetical protein
MGTLPSSLIKVAQMMTTTTTTAIKVTTGDLFFLGGVCEAGVSAFLLLRLLGLSVSRLLRAIATDSKIEIRIYRGRTFGTCRKQVLPDGCGFHINLFSSFMKYQMCWTSTRR